MADFDWKISVFCILRMTLLALFINIMTSEGVRLQDVHLRLLTVPLHCQSVNHCKEHENDRDLWIDRCFNHFCKNDESLHLMAVENGKIKVIYFCSGPRFCDVDGTCVARCPPHLTRDLCDCACKLENETLACQHEIPGAWFNGEINISTTTNPMLNNTTTGSESVRTERSHTKNEGLDTAVTVIIAVRTERSHTKNEGLDTGGTVIIAVRTERSHTKNEGLDTAGTVIIVMIAVLLILVGTLIVVLIVVLYKCNRDTQNISYNPSVTYIRHADRVFQSPQNSESDTETEDSSLDDSSPDV